MNPNDIKINYVSAYMAYDEIGEIETKNYKGNGKWKAEITDWAPAFSKELAEAQGYKFDHYDYYGGINYYIKIVGIESFTAVDIAMKMKKIASGDPWRDTCVRVAVPECLKKEINDYLIASGDIVLSAEIFRKLVEHYTVEKIIELEREQGSTGKLFYDYYHDGIWRFIDYKQPKEETDKT